MKMWKRRLLWALTVVLTAGLYFFDNHAGTLLLLLTSILLPLSGFLVLLCPLSAEITVQSAAGKGQRVVGRLSLKNGGILPLARVRIDIACRNLRTGQCVTETVEEWLPPRRCRDIEFTLDCSYCGRLCLEITGATAFDLFSLVKRRRPCEAKAAFSVLPNLFEPEVVLESSAVSLPDSDTYSADRPGSDPGEIFAVREYAPGDPLRTIHWKLSEKTDRLMVREFGMPVVNEVLLLLETAGTKDPAVTDAVTEVFVSLSSALLARGCAHQAGWQGENGALCLRTLSRPEELGQMLEELLCLPPREEGSVARCFSAQSPHCGFAHAIVAAPQIPAGMRELVSGNRVTLLLCGSGTEGLQPDGTYAVTFDAGDYERPLGRLEV